MKKIIIISSSIIILSLILLFLHLQTYSLLDITADNYKTKLKESHHPIWYCALDNYIPDDISLWVYSSEYKVIQRINVKAEVKQLDSHTKRITISQTPSGLEYVIVFEDQNPIQCDILNSHYQFDPQLVTLAEKLILKQQFILKKSELIHGQDILIAETEDDFIIIVMNTKCDYKTPPMSMHISTYSKKRFF